MKGGMVAAVLRRTGGCGEDECARLVFGAVSRKVDVVEVECKKERRTAVPSALVTCSHKLHLSHT